MKRITVIVKGEVQRVGYRDEVQRVARKLGIKGYVENIKPYDVRIVAEGEEKDLKEFIKAIKIERFPIEVESIDVKWDKATDEFEYFEIKRGPPEEELGERLDAAAKYLFRSVQLGERSVELSEKSVALGERSVEIGEKMLEKQDLTISEIRQGFSRMDQNFTTLRDDYGRISDKMDSIDKTLQKLTKAILKLAERSGR